MTNPHRVEYFLGANSPTGFYSLYQHLMVPETARRIYILKGGPGCGKSTLMGRVARQLEEKGTWVERILCSGDPDSLDGVIVPSLGVALVDGTAPHAGPTERHPCRIRISQYGPKVKISAVPGVGFVWRYGLEIGRSERLFHRDRMPYFFLWTERRSYGTEEVDKGEGEC